MRKKKRKNRFIKKKCRICTNRKIDKVRDDLFRCKFCGQEYLRKEIEDGRK